MRKIFVTKPYLPDLAEYQPYLEKIWESGVLSNGGNFHQELEKKLAEYLGVKYISLFANGTLALITALQTLKIKGEVITTPFSFVATGHSLLWHGNSPVFVDIDPITLNIDPKKIEAAITEKTSAIMPVHCFGNPCDVHEIERISSTYNVPVIYDAAHAFGVFDNDNSVLNFGELSVLSFHATKVFNTFEGGAIISHTKKHKDHIDNLKNFGFVSETNVIAAGINGKMSEVNAAFGLLQLTHVDEVISERAKIHNFYRDSLRDVAGIRCHLQYATIPNYSYFPIIINPEFALSRDELYEEFKRHEVYTRRYFYPLISNFSMYRSLPTASKKNLPVSNLISDRILCLPIYPGLDFSDQVRIINIIRNFV